MPDPHPPPRPRAVATDLDGTLLRTDGTLSDRARGAIAAAEACGVPTVFVTARPPRWLDGLADVVGAHGVAVCGNGAFVYDLGSRTVVAHRSIEADLLRTLESRLRAAIPEIAFAVERADGLGREASFVYRSEVADGHDQGTFAQITATPVGKLLARCEAMDPALFLRCVAEVVGGRAEIGFSGAHGLAEMTAPGVTKATGLAAWCDEHGYDAADVWAFGDMPNDLPMLRWAGSAFAVANAHPDVLAVADCTVAANDEDGVARMLETIPIRGAL